MKPTPENSIALFGDKQVRRIWHNNRWYFSVIDVIAILTDQVDYKKAKTYWTTLKSRLKKEGSEVVTKCDQLKLPAQDGKMRKTDVLDTEGILRLIQSIPSPKAEPFKRWLAKVGYERIQEIENPELAMQRMITTYKKKGYPEEWIDVRVRGIQVRHELTDTWKQHGAGGKDYAILTDEIYKAFAGMTNREYKEYKGIDKGNLRDGMEPMELILTMLAEQSTKEITQARNSQGLNELKQDSKDGGSVAKKARQELIEKTGKDPISDKNYIEEIKKLGNKKDE